MTIRKPMTWEETLEAFVRESRMQTYYVTFPSTSQTYANTFPLAG